MAGLIVTKKQLVMLIKKHGGKASVSDSNKTLMRKANALGLGAKKAKPQYIGQPARPRKRRARRSNPGPDPYRKDMLILNPAGISYTGPFGPFGQYDPQRRSNPGLPSPGQVVGGVGDYMQMNPLASAHGRDQCAYSGCRQRVVQNESFCPRHQAEYEASDVYSNPPMGDYLLEREVVQDGLSGLNDYMLLDMTPPAPRKNPGKVRYSASQNLQQAKRVQSALRVMQRPGSGPGDHDYLVGEVQKLIDMSPSSQRAERVRSALRVMQRPGSGPGDHDFLVDQVQKFLDWLSATDAR